MARRSKSEPQSHQMNLGVWYQFWNPPRKLRIKDIFPHFTVKENGLLFVRDEVVTANTISKDWPFFRNMIDEEDLPKVYKQYKKAIDEWQERLAKRAQR